MARGPLCHVTHELLGYLEGRSASHASTVSGCHHNWGMSSEVLAELSYEAAVRALDLQERGVEQLRARTGTLLAASSLTASFLGAQTIQHAGGLQTLGSLALISLAASIVLWSWALAATIS
jgi:hypothetical protein